MSDGGLQTFPKTGRIGVEFRVSGLKLEEIEVIKLVWRKNTAGRGSLKRKSVHRI